MNEELNHYNVCCDDDCLVVPESIIIDDDVMASLQGYVDAHRGILEQHSAIAIEFKVEVPHRMIDTDGEDFDEYNRFDWSYTVLRIERYTTTVEFGSGSTKIWICI
jgi:hypothetical protein